MNRLFPILLSVGLIYGAALPVMAQSVTAILYWGYGGVTRAREWVGPEGRMGQQSLLDGQASAWDIWPTAGTLPTSHEISEVVLHRTLWDNSCIERMSLAAMTDAAKAGEYRVSIETSAECARQPHGLLFCFDNPIPGGPANCRFWVRVDGVYTSDDGVTWRRL